MDLDGVSDAENPAGAEAPTRANREGPGGRELGRTADANCCPGGASGCALCRRRLELLKLTEGEGFEPSSEEFTPETVFETAAFNRSATPPGDAPKAR